VTEDVRWLRPSVEHSWRYGTLVSLVAENVEISASGGNKGRYTVGRQYVEKKVLGPRGGVRWEKL
jgi:hypothetical protein